MPFELKQAQDTVPFVQHHAIDIRLLLTLANPPAPVQMSRMWERPQFHDISPEEVFPAITERALWPFSQLEDAKDQAARSQLSIDHDQ